MKIFIGGFRNCQIFPRTLNFLLDNSIEIELLSLETEQLSSRDNLVLELLRNK